MTSAPRPLYPDDRMQEVLIALRGLLSRNPCAAEFGSETLSRLLCEEHLLAHRAPSHEIECAMEALCVEGEVLA